PAWTSAAAARAARSRPAVRTSSSQELLQNRNALHCLIVRKRERGREPDRVRAGGADHETACKRGLDHVAGRLLGVEREQQPEAACVERVDEELRDLL